MPPRKRKQPVGWPGLYRTRPTVGRCRGCGQPVATGWVEGLHEQIDVTPLSGLGELAALLQGGRTFLWSETGGFLFRRTAWSIRTQTPPLAGIVVRTHACGNSRALEGPFAAEHVRTAPRIDDSAPAPF